MGQTLGRLRADFGQTSDRLRSRLETTSGAPSQNRKTPLRAARNHFWPSRRSFQTTPHSSMQSNSFSKNPPEICHVRNLFSGSFLTSQHRSNPLGAVQLCSERLMETQTRVSSFRSRTRLKSDMSGASFRVLFWPSGTARTRSELFDFARNGAWQLRRAATRSEQEPA